MAGEALARVPRRTSQEKNNEEKKRPPESKSLDDSFNEEPARERRSVRRVQTGGDTLSKMRPIPAQRGVNRALSSSGDSRRAMMNQRAMSTRDFGSGPRPGRGGLAMTRTSGGGRGGRGTPNRSMSSRFLGAASDNVFSRMASTRALFMDEPQELPSIITYLGREIKAQDHFDDEWIEDALDENIDDSSRPRGLGGSSKRRSMEGSNKRSSVMDGSSESNRNNESDRKESDDENESEEEEEEEMEEIMDEDTSATDTGTKRRGRRGMLSGSSQNRRAQSSEPGPKRTSAPPQRGVGRSRTFDGRQTSEILPRRRKLKSRTARRESPPPKKTLEQHFEYFLSRTGGITPNVNDMYQNGLHFTVETGTRRLPTRYPKSRKRIEQFKRLNYTAEDIHDVLCEDDETFQRLKRVLTKKGAITNGILEQRLHIFLKKAKDRLAKAMKERKKQGMDDEDDENLDDPTPGEWAAMSMMNMFAKSVRKLTSDTENPTVAASEASDNEPKLQKKTLPRMQAMQQKRMQANKKASRSLMSSFDEAEDESTNHDNSENLQDSGRQDQSSNRRKLADGPASPGTPKKSNLDKPWGGLSSDTKKNDNLDRPWGNLGSDTKKTDNLDKPWGGQSSDAKKIYNSARPWGETNDIKPQELPVTRPPMQLDLTVKFKETAPIAKELPVTRSPLKLDLATKFKDTPPMAKELPVTRSPMNLDLLEDFPIEPKCLDDELSASHRQTKMDLSKNLKDDPPIQPKCLDDELSLSQRPMKLDLSKTFKDDPPIQPKCLDDELSLSQRPMKLDLSKTFKDDLPIQPKCLDDELSLSQRPMKLDLSKTFKDALPIQPKCLDDELSLSQRPMKLDLQKNFKDDLPIQPKCLDDELSLSQRPMKLDLSKNFKDALPIQPRCLDDELSLSQRPMKLDLQTHFKDDLPIQPKCLDDELSLSQRPMKLDLSKTFKDDLPIQPKCLDDGSRDDRPMMLDLSSGGSSAGKLLYSPKREDSHDGKKMDDLSRDGSSRDGSKMDSSRARRRHRPSRIRNHSVKSTSSGISHISRTSSMGASSKSSATPTRMRSRRSKSSDEHDYPPLNLEIKCLDDPQTSLPSAKKNGSHRDKGGSEKPKSTSPGLFVG